MFFCIKICGLEFAKDCLKYRGRISLDFFFFFGLFEFIGLDSIM